jgi:hypothetical protein
MPRYRQFCATLKSISLDTGNAAGYGYAGKVATIPKGIITNAGEGTARKVNSEIFVRVGAKYTSNVTLRVSLPEAEGITEIAHVQRN